MIFLQRILHPQRLMRSRGYGVHSPFAFRFIRTVIGERKCAYYAYSRISALARASKVNENDLKLFFRMICEFKPERVCVLGRGAQQAFQVARMAERSVVQAVAPEKASLSWIGGDDACSEASIKATVSAQHPTALFLHRAPRLISVARQSLTHGMEFRSGSKAIIVINPYLTQQSFSILF